MRVFVAVLAVAIAVLAQPDQAVAYENFIPQGHSYSPDDPVLPDFNSEQDRVNSQVDIYEAEIYTRLRRAKSFSSQLDQFRNEQELKGGRDFIDY